MINAYFLVNDLPSEGEALTFAAALEVLPREGEVVSFSEGGPGYKVLLVQHHILDAMRVEPLPGRRLPTLGVPAAPGEDEDVPTVRHEVSVMVRSVTDDENDAFIRMNRGRAAARLVPFLADAE